MAPRTADTAAPSAGMDRCPKCLNLVKSKNLRRHLRDVCKGMVNSGLATEPTPASRSRALLRDDQPGEVEEETRLHDGTAHSARTTANELLGPTEGSHDLGQSFRDHGQFGSLSSFDSMDDESRP